MFNSKLRSGIPRLLGLAWLLCLLAGSSSAQDEALKRIAVTAADRAAAAHASNLHRHATAANTPKGKSAAKDARLTGDDKKRHANNQGGGGKHEVRYEGEVTYLGGPVVYTAESHPIYLLPGGNCPIATCWGDPEGFLRDLGDSDFIHIVDQYVGLSSRGRYTKGLSLAAPYPPQAKPLIDMDMQALVHEAAQATGFSGYTHIYHIFLPPGQDECFDATFSDCYSPDNPSTFLYCGYHSSVDFQDVGHVLYTVEPYQNVQGCSVVPGTPNGQLIDSTNSILAHETLETITDPDSDAWINYYTLVLSGEEIGDECLFVTIADMNVYFDPLVFRIDGKYYATQPIYSNELHGCSVH